MSELPDPFCYLRTLSSDKLTNVERVYLLYVKAVEAERDRLAAENERLREWREFVRYNSKEAAHAADEEMTRREGARGGKE